MMSLPFEISAQDVKSRLDRGGALALIDVREPVEHQLASIGGAELMPMSTIPAQLQHLESVADTRLVVVFCHHGIRSLNVVNWLREKGLENCISMAGGIDAWSLAVDASVPRY